MKNMDCNQRTHGFFRFQRRLKVFAQSSCASTQPEYAVLTFAVVAVLILSVAQLGYSTVNVFRSFSHDTHEWQEISGSLYGSTVSEASYLAQAVERILPRSVWTVSLQLVAVTITGIWLFWRYMSSYTF